MVGDTIDFTLHSDDLEITFSCMNYGKRVREAMRNLETTQDGEPIMSSYIASDPNTLFFFDGARCEQKGSCKSRAIFYENTEYPILIKGKDVDSNSLQLFITSEEIAPYGIYSSRDMLYGSINFKNQVGLADIKVKYTKKKRAYTFTLQTEVLSYKLNYRSDFRQIISDIEYEFSMLSYSYLKNTYLTFKQKSGKSTDLIWWQIFHQCYENIISACKTIIYSPRKRLRRHISYERADRIRYLMGDTENEFAEFQKHPEHLYRQEDLILSKDTLENRFLKYVMKELQRRYNKIRNHLLEVYPTISSDIQKEFEGIENELNRINHHSFFRGIGQFRGFNQDSLVMKKARGYNSIYRDWIMLNCGYEIEEGVNKLEVKDISELYEIWCFIKVKNIVASILGETASISFDNDNAMSGNFVKQLAYGSQSNVVFKKDGVELASVMYNAESDNSDETIVSSAIEETQTFTTNQRPDIVLRLTKDDVGIKFTYLFDAKYRLNDTQIDKADVPPEDAINQMHRYRDAIYYNQSQDNKLKKEIIGGYVLYPGNLTKEQYIQSYYHKSIEKVGIGAFPLRPKSYQTDSFGNLIYPENDSEECLRDQIKYWIEDHNSLDSLLNTSIPQHGLQYEMASIDGPLVLIGCYRSDQHLQWILGGSQDGDGTSRYNIRLGNREGSMQLNKETMSVKYIMLYKINDNGIIEEETHYLFEVVGEPKVMGENDMANLNYPFMLDKKIDKQYQRDFIYLVYPIEVAKLNVPDVNVQQLLSLSDKVLPKGAPFIVGLDKIKPILNGQQKQSTET